MYELHDEYGNIIQTNYIEHCFGKYESKFNKYRNIMIQDFSMQKSCSDDSKEYWTDYMALQILRTPYAFNVSKILFKNNSVSDIKFNNQMLYYHFPFLHDNASEKTLFSYLKSVFKQMHFFIAYAESPNNSIITSDNPICVIDNYTKFPFINPLPFEMVFFPVTEKFGICLCLENSKIIRIFKEKKSSLCQINLLNSFIFNQAQRFVYSSFPITLEELHKIQDINRNINLSK